MQRSLLMHDLSMLVARELSGRQTIALAREEEEGSWPVWRGGSQGHGGAAKVSRAIQQADTFR